MRASRRAVLLPAVAVAVPALAFGACGIGDDDTVITLPPIRTTTTTVAPSTTIDTTKSADEVQQQVDDLRGKADKLRDDLNTVMRESNGGPAAAVLGVLNQKADALNAQLTLAKADAQEDLGPKITSAQEEITTALEPVTVAVDKLCPSS